MNDRPMQQLYFFSAASLAALLSFATLACDAKSPEDEARSRLAADLTDSLGRASDPKVGFMIGGGSRYSHLVVNFDSLAFANQSDSSFRVKSRDIARFSIRHYEKSDDLDSITVAAGDEVRPGLTKILHTQTFSVADLK